MGLDETLWTPGSDPTTLIILLIWTVHVLTSKKCLVFPGHVSHVSHTLYLKNIFEDKTFPVISSQ